MRLIAALSAVVWTVAPNFAMARFSEENLPAQDLPSGAATPDNGPSADWVRVPANTATNAPQTAPMPGGNSAAQIEPTPIPSPTDIAPLEVGSVAPQMQISDAPLDNLIRTLSATQPALAASLRVTDQAREQILSNREDDALQTLQRAISIDGSNPYAFFYVGRVYLAKRNFAQAVAFLSRAENRFGNNPAWLGETEAFEGLAEEQGGQTPQAIASYQKALVAVPGNLMARVGLVRLGAAMAAAPVQPVAAGAPGSAPQIPADGSAIAPPPNAPAPPPAN